MTSIIKTLLLINLKLRDERGGTVRTPSRHATKRQTETHRSGTRYRTGIKCVEYIYKSLTMADWG